jgi:hypothetical protein
VGRLEDSKIDATVELRSITMSDKETAADYVGRARNLASKCKSLSINITDRELVYYVVRGLNGKFNRIRSTLKTQRDKKLDYSSKVDHSRIVKTNATIEAKKLTKPLMITHLKQTMKIL